MADSTATTEGNLGSLTTRTGETIARRIFHACDSCRQRKIRCDGAKPACEWCFHHGTQCTYKRNHRKTKEKLNAIRSGGQSTDTSAILERLQQTLADTLQEITYLQSRTPVDTNQDMYERHNEFGPDIHSAPYEHPVNAETVHFQRGAHSGVFSLYKGLPFFSAECQEWVKLRAGEEIRMDEYFQSQMEDAAPMGRQGQGDMWDLPPRAQLDRCLDLFHLTRLSRVFPVIEAGSLPLIIDSLYNASSDADTRACAYALITFVAAFTENASLVMDLEACNNKLQLLIHGLLLQGPTVAGLQTMLIMALCQMMQGNIQAVDQFIAIAARMLYSLGGHYPSQSHVRTLFWVCYILDKDLSLRTGHFPVICDEHCDLTLPSAYSEHTVYLHASDQPFWTDLRLSIIKSKAYNLLYSPQALNATDAELIKSIRMLGEELDEWRLGLPPAHRPAFAEPSDAACKEIRWILMHLDFYHCVTMVHQASSRCTQWSESQTHVLGVQSSFDICVAASRSTLRHLLKASQVYIHDPNFWVVIFYPMSASISLFCNILLDPLNPRAADDLALISRAPASIFQLSTKRPSQKEMNQYHALIRFIAELSRLANRAIQMRITNNS